jgi:aspartate-semialdehyde dehydrogenase
MKATTGFRVGLAGASGAVGRALAAVLDERRFPLAELRAFASQSSIGEDLEVRGEIVEIGAGMPSLAGLDLLIVCTPRIEAPEIVRAALRAGVPIIDCSASFAGAPEVALAHTLLGPPAEVPLLSLPSRLALMWLPVVQALESLAPVEHIHATLLQSVAHAGRSGQAALSEETIALLSGGDVPDEPFFGRAAAFDCVPLESSDPAEWVARDLARMLGRPLSVTLQSIQVPSFVSEASSLLCELAQPIDDAEVVAALEKAPLVTVMRSAGASLRDACDRDEVLVAGVAACRVGSKPGLRLWAVADPVRLVAGQAVRLAEQRLVADAARAGRSEG